MTDVETRGAAAGGIAFPAEIGRVIEDLRAARLDWRGAHARHAERGVHFPSQVALGRIIRELDAALYPLRLGPPELTARNENAYVGAMLETTLDQLGGQLRLELRLAQPEAEDRTLALEAEQIVGLFAARLPTLRRALDADVEAAYRLDPAARSVDEVLLCYPSLLAVIRHRVAHQLHRLGAPIVARIIAEIAHRQTGIDIHPGAEIGPGLFIDHGTGLVIGETAVLGARVHLHQGVTIGGDPLRRDLAEGARRHPVIGDDVLVFAGAALLGPIEVGARTVIDANVTVRESVPAGSFVSAPAPLVRPA